MIKKVVTLDNLRPSQEHLPAFDPGCRDPDQGKNAIQSNLDCFLNEDTLSGRTEAVRLQNNPGLLRLPLRGNEQRAECLIALDAPPPKDMRSEGCYRPCESPLVVFA